MPVREGQRTGDPVRRSGDELSRTGQCDPDGQGSGRAAADPLTRRRYNQCHQRRRSNKTDTRHVVTEAQCTLSETTNDDDDDVDMHKSVRKA